MTQSSYLISFIRNLMEHSSKDVREKKKRQLETEFTQTGVALNNSLSEKFEDVTKILNVYNSVSERILINMDVLGKLKRDLVDCKSLLYCNREELRRLWLELVEQRHCIDLLDMLDRLQSAPDAINTLVSVRAWPEATDLTLYTAELLRSEIAVVPALNAIKAELAMKQKTIVDQLKKQLYSLIYDRPFAWSLDQFSKRSKVADNLTRESQLDFALESKPTLSAPRFASLPLPSWHSSTVDFATPNPNLRKDPMAVAQSIAANKATQATSGIAVKSRVEPTRSDEDWIRELVAVVHCLARLERLPQLLASWSPQSNLSRMQQSLENTDRTTFSGPLIPGQGLLGELHRFIVVKAINAVESMAVVRGITKPLAEVSDPQFLVMLLELVFDAFFIHSRACMLVIRAMKEAQGFVLSSFREIEGLSGDYIWSCVQYELQLLLSIHLINRSSADGGLSLPGPDSAISASSSVDVRNLELNVLLGRKRAGTTLFAASPAVRGPVKSRADVTASPALLGSSSGSDSKRTASDLFSFANTSHFQSVSTYMRENRAINEPDSLSIQSPAESVYTTVCLPNLDNIIQVYKPLMRFIESAELELAVSNSSNLPSATPAKGLTQLRSYLKNFIENTYLPETLNILRSKLQNSLSAPDSLNSIVSQQVERELGLPRPVLSIVLTLNECLQELKRMFVALPDYSDGCLNIATTLLNEFVMAMWRIYRDLSEVDSAGTTAPSSDWSQDDDVSRFWKKFPVWQRMAAHEAHLLANNLIGAYKVEGTAVELPPGQSSRESYVKSSTAVALGLYNQVDRTVASSTSTDSSSLNAHLVIPFAEGQRITSLSGGATEERAADYTNLSGLLYEREATRQAARETKKLLDMIKNELPDDSDKTKDVVRQLPTLQNMQLFKVLGRMSESLYWLSYRVLNLNTWLCNLNALCDDRSKAAAAKRQSIWDTPLSFCSQELTRLSEACLLMIYLELRIQAYNYFGGLPSGVTYWCPLDDVDVDRYVTDFLIYLEQLQDMLVRTINRHKFRFIFDGLGDFIAQLLLRMIAVIPRMNANGNRKMCRNVYRLQQALTSLTESRESDLIRVKQLFELFALTPETIIDRLMEQGVAFDASVYQDLMRLYQRSHPTYPYAKTEECIAKLQGVVSRSSTL